MSSEKTEKPTPYKLRQQRREGRTAERKNVLEAGSVVFSTVALIIMLKPFSAVALALADTVWEAINTTSDEELHNVFQTATRFALLCLLLCVSMALFSLIFGLFLNKFNFSTKSLTPKFEKFNPVSNAKSLFSVKTIYNFFRLLIYLTYLLILLYYIIYNNINNVIQASICGKNCLSLLYNHILRQSFAHIIILYAVIGLVDYVIQNRLFLRMNKMSKEEVKREYKTQEGDPQIKGARRSIAINDALLPGPQQATHVVCTDQCLVAIMYHAERDPRPFVVTKVSGPGTARMREIYKALGVPTVFLPAVALDFFRMATLGDYLPPRSARGMEKIMQALSPAVPVDPGKEHFL